FFFHDSATTEIHTLSLHDALPILHAQAPAPTDGGALEEVVVTAQKRAEALESVPVSVTVLTGAQLGELKFDSPSDLVTQIPNLQDRKSTRLNSSHRTISYAVFCLK